MSEEPKPAHGPDADALEDADTQAAPFDVEATDDEVPLRRRRPVADWGGDDLFDYVPRRRFRSGGAHPRRAGSVPAPAPTSRRNSDLFEAPGARPVAHRGDVELNAAHIRSSYTPRRAAVAEELTGESLTAEEVLPPARRERPALPMSQRLGPRPDRIAAWAFVLGLLLILLAVGTADASGF